MTDAHPDCPLCASGTREGGAILHPASPLVAGVPIDLGDTKYCLRNCNACGFAFKWPRISETQLLACYRDAPSAQWGEQVDPHERAYDFIASLIKTHAAGRRILDVGCFTGTLLDYLGNDWDRSGVEPAADAAAIARQRGIRLPAATIEQLPDDTEPFDIIVSIDVLEHLTHPTPHLRAIARHLKPGGCFLAVTGDTSSWPWRLQKSRHWYAALPEHVSFFNPACLAGALGPLGLTLTTGKRFRHTRLPAGDVAGQTLKNLAYALAIRTHRVAPNPLTRIAHRRCAPVWLAAKDHMAVVFHRHAHG